MKPVIRHFALLDANTTVAFGDPVNVGAAIPGSLSVHTEGLVGTDRVQIYISNEKEYAESNIVQFSTDISADGMLKITTPSRWLIAKQSAITGGGTLYVWASWLEHV